MGSRKVNSRHKNAIRLRSAKDHAERAFADLDATVMVGVYSRLRRELVETASRLLPEDVKVGGAGVVLWDEAATSFMSRLLSTWAERLTLPDWDAAKWLYIVRRIPSYMLTLMSQGALDQPTQIDDLQAESLRLSVARMLPLSANSGPSRTAPVREGAISYFPINKTDALVVLEQVVTAAHFVLLAGTARTASKGGRVVVRSDLPPYCEYDEKLFSAIDAYDRRLTPGLSLIAVVGAEFAIEVSEPSPSTIYACSNSRKPEVCAVPAEVEPAARGRGVEVRFEASLLDIKPYLDTVANLPADDRSWFSEYLPAVLALLHCFSGDEQMAREAAEWQVRRLGYVRTSRSLLNQSYSDRATDLRMMRRAMGIDPDPPAFGAVLRELSQLPASHFPVLPGPLIRSVNGSDEILVDIFSATDLFVRSLLLASARGGAASNARGGRFEDDVQALIDRTPWKPRPEYRALRKFLKRLDGTTLTDIDAVAGVGNDLLLVSAKSYAYSLDYSIGDFRTVRNVQTKLEADVARWQEVVSYLRDNRKGRNYAIAPTVNIYGTVITPFPAFAPNSMMHESAPGLRALSSADELYRFLRKAKVRNGKGGAFR